MQRSEFWFDLPEELIAQYPTAQRTASRLLSLDGHSGEFADHQFTDIVTLLRPGDLLVMNDTRVVRARLYGSKASGGRLELLVERVLEPQRALAQVRHSRSLRPGSRFTIDGGSEVLVEEKQGRFLQLRLLGDVDWSSLMARQGHMPLPPYIHRADEAMDESRYQTVYARVDGAVAAPTAGLHFDDGLLETLQDRGVALGWLTLHVGAGTFEPVRVDKIENHKMHAETLTVSEALCQQVKAARARGARVVAVGTTSVRALESVADEHGLLRPYQGDTSIYITPGYRFRCVDAMITNFHLPESTLMMLISAFAGHAQVMRVYRHAVAQRYRFFSYGDAMFITRRGGGAAGGR